MSILRFLLLEDNLSDAETIQAVLAEGGIAPQLLRVETRDRFVTALETAEFDLILAAYALLDFDGMAALEVAHTLRPDLPFIFVSASLGEELAIEALKRGATDYVLKQRLERLVPCVQRALREVQERQDRKRAEQMLIEQKQLLEMIALGRPLESCLSAVCAAITQLNSRLRASFLLTDARGLAFSRLVTPDFAPTFGQGLKDAPIAELAIGTCGTAVYLGKSVTCADIAHDDRWSQDWRDLCLAHGILACHSTPVLDRDGLPLGSLMLAFAEARLPTDWENQLAEFGVHIASIGLERDRSSLALRKSEAKYRALFESIDEGFCICELLFDENGTAIDYRFLEVNPIFEAMTGLEQATGKTARELLHLEADWLETYGRLMQTGEPVRFEQQSIALNRWFEVHAFCLGEPQGNQFAILFTDISEAKRVEGERKQAEATLHQVAAANAFRATLFHALRSLTDAEEIQATAARVLGEHLGASRVIYAEVLPSGEEVFVHRNYTNDVVEIVGRYHLEDFGRNLVESHRGGQTVNVPDVQNSLTLTEAQKTAYKAVDIAAHLDVPLIKNDRFVALLAVHQATPRIWTQEDINRVEETAEWTWAAVQRAYSEAAQRESEARLRFMLDASQIGEWDLDLTTQPYTASRSLRHDQIFGYESLLPKWSYEIFLTHVHPADRAAVNEKFQQTLSASTHWNFECRIIHADQSLHWIWVRSSVYCDPNGTPTRLLGMVVDITNRKRIETALQESEAQSRNLLESITDAFFAVDQNWRFTYVNQTAETLINRTADDLIGKVFWEEFPGVNDSAFEQMHRRVMHDRVAESLTEFYPDHARWYEVRSYPAVNGITMYFTNVTDRIQVEAALRQTSAELERQLQRFDTIARSVPDLIYTFDLSGRFTYSNQQLFDLLQKTSDEVLGKNFFDLEYPTDLATRLQNQIQQVIETRQLVRGETPFTSAFGDHVYEYIFVPLFAANGSVEAVAGVTRDITERKQSEAALQEQTNLLQLIIDSIGDGLILANLQGKFVLVNQAAERIFGQLTNERSCDEWSKTYGLFLPDRQTFFPDEQLPLYRAMQGEYATDIEVFVRRDPAATGRWISISGFPVRDASGEITGGVITCRDVSDRVRGEDERKRLLQQEQAARAAAERANRLKDEFLAVLSHELRSPLNPILGWTRLLQNGKLDAARQAEALKTIERNAKLQTQLIEDLLDISRIMQGKLSLTAAPVGLPFVISAALETVRLAAEAKNIQMTLDLDPDIAFISGDAARLQQVVWNLLTNAVKFTPNHGQVRVELRQIAACGGQSQGLAQIRVIDTGKGITADFLPHVFEYFRQEDGSITRRFGGLGLGLAIVRQIVEMHGGTVWAESEGENQGATFVVQLPLIEPATLTLSDITHSQTDAELLLDNVQILLVDDESDTREFQTFLLEQNGAKVTAVASGLEALQVLEQFIPDLLISDIAMPEMDGYMLMQQMRSLKPTSEVPAVALTAYAGEQDQRRSLAAGFQAHLAKPVDPKQLLQTIRDLMTSFPSS